MVLWFDHQDDFDKDSQVSGYTPLPESYTRRIWEKLRNVFKDDITKKFSKEDAEQKLKDYRERLDGEKKSWFDHINKQKWDQFWDDSQKLRWSDVHKKDGTTYTRTNPRFTDNEKLGIDNSIKNAMKKSNLTNMEQRADWIQKDTKLPMTKSMVKNRWSKLRK